MTNPVDAILDGWFGERPEDSEDEDNRTRHLYAPLRKLFISRGRPVDSAIEVLDSVVKILSTQTVHEYRILDLHRPLTELQQRFDRDAAEGWETFTVHPMVADPLSAFSYGVTSARALVFQRRVLP